MDFIKFNQITNNRKVLFLSSKDDNTFLKELAIDLLRIEELEIYYTESNNLAIDDLLISNFLLVFYPVTRKLLNDKELISLIKDIMNKNIPMLPIMVEEGLDTYFNKIIGEREFINKFSKNNTELVFEEKLSNYLKTVIVDNNLSKKIINNYLNSIFLSYRKKDRQELNNLIKIIRNEVKLDTTSIWYDEFLTLGEDYNQIINDEIKNCDIFILLITSNILEDNNYVYKNEYPYAVELNKKIIGYIPNKLTIEEEAKLKSMYPLITLFYDHTIINQALVELFNNNENNYDPYLLALGKLYGIGTIKNVLDGFLALNVLVNNNLAIDKLIDLYNNGKVVKQDNQKALDLINKRINTYEIKEYYDENIELKEKLFLRFNIETRIDDLDKVQNTFQEILELMLSNLEIVSKEYDIGKLIPFFKLKKQENLKMILNDISDLLIDYVEYFTFKVVVPTFYTNYICIGLSSLLYLSNVLNDHNAAQKLMEKIITTINSTIFRDNVQCSFLFNIVKEIKYKINEDDYNDTIITFSFLTYENKKFSNIRELVKNELLNVIKSIEQRDDFISLNNTLEAYNILNKEHEYDYIINQITSKIKEIGEEEYYCKISVTPLNDEMYYGNQYYYLKKQAFTKGFYLYKNELENALSNAKDHYNPIVMDELTNLIERLNLYDSVYSEFHEKEILIKRINTYFDLTEYFLKQNDISSSNDVLSYALEDINEFLRVDNEENLCYPYNIFTKYYYLLFKVKNNHKDKIESIKNYLIYYEKESHIKGKEIYNEISLSLYLYDIKNFYDYCFAEKDYDNFLMLIEFYLQESIKLYKKDLESGQHHIEDSIFMAILVLNHERRKKKHIIDYNFVKFLSKASGDTHYYLYNIYLFLSACYFMNKKTLNSSIAYHYFMKHKKLWLFYSFLNKLITKIKKQ